MSKHKRKESFSLVPNINSTLWLIEPRDPLIFRNGKPFTPTPGAHAQSLSFPFPSTTTGGLRSKVGIDKGIFQQEGYPNNAEFKYLKKLYVRGPLLAQLDEQQNVATWLLPAPADALLLKPKEEQPASADTAAAQQPASVQLHQLIPLEQNTIESDLKPPKGKELLLVGLPQPHQEKPLSGPHYWQWKQYLAWLRDPEEVCRNTRHASELGFKGPQHERRTHVGMDHETHSGKDGALFSTSGLEFMQYDPANRGDEDTLQDVPDLSKIHHLALGLILEKDAAIPKSPTEGVTTTKEKAEGAEESRAAVKSTAKAKAANNSLDETIQLKGYATLGGERRIVSWHRARENDAIKNLIIPPKDIIEGIKKSQRCRLILLTPAYFRDGYYPEWILQKRADIDVQPKLVALLNQPPQVVSGWSMERDTEGRGKRKQTLRLTPAGSVFYLTLEGSKAAIGDWVQKIWLSDISDYTPAELSERNTHAQSATESEPDSQYSLDGFGLAILGLWNGPLPVGTVEQDSNKGERA